MSRINPIDAREVGFEVRAALDELHLKFAEVPSFIRILAKSPAAIRAYLHAEGALANGRLNPQQREKIALAMSEMNNSPFCLAAHATTGKDAGLSSEEMQMARKAASNDAKTDAMLRFVKAVLLQHGEIRDEDLEAVRRARISDSEVIEVVANIGLNSFANYLSGISRSEAPVPLLLPGTPVGSAINTAGSGETLIAESGRDGCPYGGGIRKRRPAPGSAAPAGWRRSRAREVIRELNGQATRSDCAAGFERNQGANL